MRLNAFADMNSLDVIIRRHGKPGWGHSVFFEKGVHVRVDKTVRIVRGHGKSLTDAKRDFVKQIRGKQIAVYFSHDFATDEVSCQIFSVPSDLAA